MKKILIAAIVLGFTLTITNAQILYVPNGTTGIKPSSNDYIGIGTNDPKELLHVNGNYYGLGHIFLYAFEGDGNSGTAYLQARDRSGTSNIGLQLRTQNNGNIKNVLKLTDDGKVGIGTTTPETKLDILTTDFYGLKLKRNTNKNRGIALELANAIDSAWDVGVGANTHFGIFKHGCSFGEQFIITNDGNVGIGTTTTGNHKLAVDGSIGAREIQIESSEWSDFVFEDNFELKSINELESYIDKNKRLPDIPSASEVEKEGIKLGEMNAKLLQKVEELTLYMIEQNKRIEKLEKENELLKEQKSL
jgi:hypothetical protein